MYFISDYEKQYMDALINIYDNGFSDGINERTNYATKRLPGIIFKIDVEKEFPILKSKFVAAKTAQREIEWIWKQQSNNIHDLKANIWNSWSDKDGSIGKAYGYQMAKPVKIYTDPIHKTPDSYREYANQAEYVIEYLREFPNGRWANVTLWNVAELADMNLVPCVHTSTWNLDGGRLNCVLDQRSGDMPYGVPFNTTQYAELMCMIAKELNVKPGILVHVIADAHIYDNQMEGVKHQILNWRLMQNFSDPFSNANAYTHAANIVREYEKDATADEIIERCKEVVASKPHFEINTDKSFFEYTADDCKVEDYKYMSKISFGDVAV